MNNIENEIKNTGEAIMNALNEQINRINSSPLNDTEKKQLIEMAKGIKESIATQDLDIINKITKFA